MTHHLLLVRHGESVDRDRCHGARSDPGLSVLGRRQAAAAALRVRVLANELGRVTRLLRSPAQRTEETAAPIAATLGLRPVTDEDWRERDWGEWEGERWDDCWARTPAEVTADPAAYLAFTPPGGETAAAVAARVRSALAAVPRDPGTTVVVTHAGAIRQVLASVLDLPLAATLQIDVAHGRVTALALTDGTATLLRVGA